MRADPLLQGIGVLYIADEFMCGYTFGRWWEDDVTPMLLVSDSAELWLRAGWRVRATVHGAINGSTQLVLEVCSLSRH